MPDPMFERLYARTSELTWPAADELRRVARGRARRRTAVALAASFVTVLAVAGGTIALTGNGRANSPADQGAPSASTSPAPQTWPSSTPPSPAASTSPTTSASAQTQPPSRPAPLTAIPEETLLNPSDLGSGTTVHHQLGDWGVGFTLSLCPNRSQDPYESIDRRAHELLQGSDRSVTQSLSLYRRGVATQAFQHQRARLRSCASFTDESVGYSFTISILAEGFVGAQSMLVEVRNNHGYRGLHAIVRQGELIAEVRVTPETEQFLREMAGVAARRMCAVQGC